MKKHWTKFLPEAYVLKHEQHYIEIKYIRLELAEQEVDIIKKEIELEEGILFERVKKEWTDEEISKAKKQSLNEQENEEA